MNCTPDLYLSQTINQAQSQQTHNCSYQLWKLNTLTVYNVSERDILTMQK